MNLFVSLLRGNATSFVSYQVKIVMTSTNSSTPPLFRDLRVIATA